MPIVGIEVSPNVALAPTGFIRIEDVGKRERSDFLPAQA
jgi:hypothetical protein